MLIDDLKEKLKNIEPDFITIKNFWKNSSFETEFEKLSKLNDQENFWKNPEQKNILKTLQKIRTNREQYLDIVKKHDEIHELINLFANDETELENIKDDIYQLIRQIKKFKIALLLSDEQDNSNCFMNI